MAEFRLETERLLMREWRDNDLEVFHAINSDPKVRETLGPIMTRDQVAELITRLQAMQKKDGCCFWALETKSDEKLIGWCGMIRGSHPPIDDKLEIGWRLASDTWGNGYITEAAKACINWANEQFPEEEVWAITSDNNRRSRAVMDRLDMEYLPELDFDHPSVDPDSDLLLHVTYRTKEKI